MRRRIVDKLTISRPHVSDCRPRLKRLNTSVLALAMTMSLSLGIVSHVWAQATGEFSWLLQFGTTANDQGWDVDTDADGNVYVAGDTRGELPGQISSEDQDAFVRKYDANGNEIWTRQFGTVAVDRAFAIAVFGADVYVAGLTSGAFPGYTNIVGTDAFLRKYDEHGTELWTRQFGTPGADEAIGIFVDATGVYVSGLVTGALPDQTSKGNADAFVRKYDANGNELWTQQVGTLGRDTGFRISGDASGVYLAGAAAGALPGQIYQGGPVDAFIRKYDQDGNQLWTRQYGTAGTDLAIGVATDAGGVYVVGRADGALPGQTQPVASPDAYVRKYDVNGNELWTHQFGSALFDLARGVSVRNSVVYLSGVTGGASGMFPAAAGADVFVRAYTGKGKHLWTSQFGSAVAEENWAITAGVSGLFVVGSTAGTLPGLVSQLGIDAFVGKLTQELAVEIDIKPGDDSNTINLGSRGVVPVAILSSDAFDATAVDPATVLLDGAGLKLRGQHAPMASVEDVNGDGLLDLVLHFETEALDLTSSDVVAELTALTFGGRVVFGFDYIRIVP